MENLSPQHGEVWLVNFEPQIGHEIKKSRPAIVINNALTNKLATRIILPIRSFREELQDNFFYIRIFPGQTNGLVKVSLIDCVQIKSFDLTRFLLRLGFVEEELLDLMKESVADCL